MMIDDNGKGLCTTGLGHGDAQHCADLDPYRKYAEQFTCNESQPACTYYNATTGEIYYRLKSTSDDGRALCGNFSNDFVGSIGRSTQRALYPPSRMLWWLMRLETPTMPFSGHT
jgi:hypothetical protein